jgi:hypothetical protein
MSNPSQPTLSVIVPEYAGDDMFLALILQPRASTQVAEQSRALINQTLLTMYRAEYGTHTSGKGKAKAGTVKSSGQTPVTDFFRAKLERDEGLKFLMAERDWTFGEAIAAMSQEEMWKFRDALESVTSSVAGGADVPVFGSGESEGDTEDDEDDEEEDEAALEQALALSREGYYSESDGVDQAELQAAIRESLKKVESDTRAGGAGESSSSRAGPGRN